MDDDGGNYPPPTTRLFKGEAKKAAMAFRTVLFYGPPQ